MSQRFTNQQNLLNQTKLHDTNFVVIGAGAIGSYFTMTLSKMGARKVTVFDFDVIEDKNIANQVYPKSAVGKLKVDALWDIAFSYGDCLIDRKRRWSINDAVDGDIVVVAPDNMDVRKTAWDYYKTRPIKFFLDGRMSAQVYKVYGIDMSNNADKCLYEQTLHPQSEAAQERCGEKSIIYTVLQVSGQMLSQVKRYLMGERRPTEVIADLLNDTLSTKYTTEAVYETIDA